MQTKLTLRLEEELIERAKLYAKQSGKSLSQMVADYFVQLEQTIKPPAAQDLPPATRALRGILKPALLDKQDYHRHLEEKYL